MSDAAVARERRSARTRLRSGLRRHGIVPRPAELRAVLGGSDVRFTTGNQVELYKDGASGLAAMLDAIEGARRSVHLETYILRGDETGRRFLDALTARAREGVEVRLLYDAVGSLGVPTEVFRALRAAGGDVVLFNPRTRLWPVWAPRRRDHRKILAVDGAVAFVGGLNIGDEYYFGADFQGRERTPWRDGHVRVVGPAVRLLEAVFLESWFRADGPDHPAPVVPAVEGVGNETLAVISDGPTYRRRRMRELMIAALAGARESVQIATPYFLPGRRLRAALKAAAGRGVTVEVLIAGYSDHPILRWAARALAPRLLTAGVRLFEYERAMMHAKVAVFDGRWAVLGTSNLDRQSLEHSYEVNLVADGGTLPARLAEMLEEDLAAARPLTPRELAARSWTDRLRDRVAGWLLGRL